MAVKEVIDFEALYQDLGLEDDKLGKLAKAATTKYLQGLTANENNELEGHLECMAATYFEGYRKALEDSVLKEAISRL